MTVTIELLCTDEEHEGERGSIGMATFKDQDAADRAGLSKYICSVCASRDRPAQPQTPAQIMERVLAGESVSKEDLDELARALSPVLDERDLIKMRG